MFPITKATLREYLHDLLPQQDSVKVEQALRTDEAVRKLFDEVRSEEDRGEHTVGAIWKREHITCPARDELGGYVMKALAPERLEYIRFHLEIVGCQYCGANVDDLHDRRKAKRK